MNFEIPERLLGHHLFPRGMPSRWCYPDSDFVTWVVQTAADIIYQPYDFKGWILEWRQRAERMLWAELDILLPAILPGRQSQFVIEIRMGPQFTGASLVEEFASPHASDRTVDMMELKTGLVSDFVGWFAYIKETWLRDSLPRDLADFGVKQANIIWALPLQVAAEKAKADDLTFSVVKERRPFEPIPVEVDFGRPWKGDENE